jgi:hypothetical protein
MRRYALRDDQWDRIKDFLPGREGHVGGTAADNRLFVEAVLYRYRAGLPWRDLPERFGVDALGNPIRSRHVLAAILKRCGPSTGPPKDRIGLGLAAAGREEQQVHRCAVGVARVGKAW